MMKLILSVQLLFSCVLGQVAEEGLTGRGLVSTTNGPVLGFRDHGIHTFKNIPYGADTANTRFQAPRRPAPWTEPKVCTEYGFIAPQPTGNDINGTVQNSRSSSIFMEGTGTVNDALYDGVRLAKTRNVVVVTVNHRVNGFGYLYLGGVSSDYQNANPGQADLILALEWVRDNIERFGGDKNRITIFGQSGGGAKCATLMAQPAAKGLFHRVWTMSGAQITGRTLEHAKETTQTVLAKVSGADNTTRLSALLNMSMEELRVVLSPAGNNYAPVVEGLTLPRDPFFPTANEQSRDIPMVMGNTYDETRNLIGGSNETLFNLTWETLPEAIERNVRQYIGNMTGSQIASDYRTHYPELSPSDVFFAATTAARSWKSMQVQLNIRVAPPHSPTWVYYLRWRTPTKEGAAHAFDIPLVFNNPSAMKQTAGAPGVGQLADDASLFLANFATTGDPNGFRGGKDPRDGGRKRDYWPRYEVSERRSMLFDVPVEVVSDDRGWEREYFMNEIYIQPGT
ncbi:alpha/beta-hydrolase [Eremomyces bilateralis CBS 781.70]|uniref:Carboxylic ester hydrolase n=1 Tax=Eremomyces bilateralis CBS 781.70 TaxID=1392243 RepID=A0A6G1GC53_9PEZI|nr:alpha/beta-hydrolase [Eremomyces bilateralis CBS 781.70]KAF1815667.1 alpha/beta-hydrolase [Eremomyces bilateralis CBS 781.70]